MRVQKFGHSCLLVTEGTARILVDPGTLSRGFESLTELTAVLITHQHFDHVDTDRLGALLAANPGARVYADAATASQLADHDPVIAREDEHFDVGGLSVDVVGSEHAIIHPDLPVLQNVGYLFGGRFLHPGDAFTIPRHRLDVLALPVAAPWLKLSEAVDYLRAVAPRTAIPIHEGASAAPQVLYSMIERLRPDGTTLRVIDDGEPIDL